MSAISLKSITGITSITTPAGVDNVFTVHTNDTVERFRIDQSGSSISGILTVTQDLDVDGHTNLDNVSIAGVVTATAYHGDGSNLTGITGVTINNNVNNRLVTATGTTGTLDGEGNLTYDGNTLQVATDTNMEGIKITSSGNTYNDLTISANRSGSNNHIGRILGQWNGQNVSAIIFNTGADTSGKDDGKILFATSNGGASPTTRMTIEQDGQITQTAASGDTILTLKRSDTNTTGLTGGINFAASDDHSVASIQARGDGDNEGAHLQFHTTSAAAGDIFNAANVERLRITSGGNVRVTSGVIENSNTISSNYTVSSNYNAMSAGPMSVANGVSVTVPSGSAWTIV